MDSKIDKLKLLYENTSKHSSYQSFPSELKACMKDLEINTVTRHDKRRLDFFLKNINVKNKKVLDIGGNTGFFSFEFLRQGAKSLEYYDGNKEHAEFVRLSSDILNYGNEINIYNEYYDFNKNEKYEIVLLLNVLHHLGDDFGDNKISKENALKIIIELLKIISQQTELLIFQMGFNWKGDVHLPFFKNGTKKELIDYVCCNLKDEFEIINIGIAEKCRKKITYRYLTNKNIHRNDDLGEFLNRPIFIMRSKLV